jgi:CheY-like chemotaxis protein
LGATEVKLKVVYIEDNPSNLRMVVRILEATGHYEVLTAPDGEAGLELVMRELPALVLVDLDVPEVNGFEVTRKIKGSPDPAVARIPVAAISANVLADERAASLAAGAVAFIEKPFDIHAFRAQVAALIEAASGTGTKNP